MCLIHAIGGAFSRRPEELDLKLSTRSADLVKRAFDNIDPHRLIDHHVHVAGLGIGGTRNLVNRKMRTWRHPFHRLKFKVYMSSAGVKDEAMADQQLVERLAGLVGHIRAHGKHRLLGFDKHYRRDGSVDLCVSVVSFGRKSSTTEDTEDAFPGKLFPSLFCATISTRYDCPDANCDHQ